jgi:hypothetical protein
MKGQKERGPFAPGVIMMVLLVPVRRAKAFFVCCFGPDQTALSSWQKSIGCHPASMFDKCIRHYPLDPAEASSFFTPKTTKQEARTERAATIK